jgi:hypothetical protein
MNFSRVLFEIPEARGRGEQLKAQKDLRPDPNWTQALSSSGNVSENENREVSGRGARI